MGPRSIRALPIRREAYAPYGDLLAAGTPDEPARSANLGTARVFDRRVAIEDRRAGAAPPNVSVFRCAPWTLRPIEVALLERHAFSTQLFVPMTARRYLAVVALGGDSPDLATAAAFLVGNAQGISYRPGVWHHPLIVLDAPADFACLVHEDGTSRDCEVRSLADADRFIVDLDDAT